MEIAALGIDIGKTWFHLVGVDALGKPVLREKLNRQRLLQFMATCQRCLVGMEACAGAHHLARRFASFGHDVKLIAPRFVKAYLKSNKNDFNDAAAIAEAVQRPTMRFVAVRSIEQVDLQAIHRVRDQLVCERPTVINQIRAFLLEYGLPVAVGRSRLLKQLPTVLEDAENGVSHAMRRLLSQLQQLSSAKNRSWPSEWPVAVTMASSRRAERALHHCPTGLGLDPLVRSYASTAQVVRGGESVSTSPAGAVSGTRRKAEASRRGNPSGAGAPIALVRLAICIGDCSA